MQSWGAGKGQLFPKDGPKDPGGGRSLIAMFPPAKAQCPSVVLSAVNENLKGEMPVKKYCKTWLTVTPKDVTILKQLLSLTWG